MIPPNHTEESVLEAVEKAVRLLARRFVFGYFTIEDIRQQARQFALEALPKYDPSRPLPNFLYSHVRNRLCNFKRDRFRRNDPPCARCHSGDSCPKATASGAKLCPPQANWAKRNGHKANLLRPQGLDSAPDAAISGRELPPGEEACRRETLARLDAAIPAALRPAYVRMLAGEAVPAREREAVGRFIRELLGGEE